MNDMDPVAFGRLQAEVHMLSGLVEKQGENIEKILEIINKSKGGLWVIMTASSAVGGVLALIIQWLWGPHK